MDKFTGFTKKLFIGLIILLVIGGIIGIPYLMSENKYKKFIANFMDEDDVENAIHIFYTVGDKIDVSGKVTAKLKKRMDVTITSEYVNVSELQFQKYSVYRYIVQLNAKDHILVTEHQFQAIKMNDFIQFHRMEDGEELYINLDKYEEK